MKKRICSLLSLSLLLVSLSMLSAAAEVGDADTGHSPTLSGTINDHLVAYWNFEGASLEEQLQDQAPMGAAQDQLTMHGDAVEITDGIAYVPKADGNGFSAGISEDLIGIESLTVYAKLKYNGVFTEWADSIYYDGLYRLYNYQYDATYEDASMRTTLLGISHIASALTQPMDTWFYAAVTVETDFENQKAICSIYISNDGMIWDATTVERELTDAEVESIQKAVAAEGRAPYIGKSSRLLDRKVDFWFDDVRIYSKALSADELALIQPNTTDLRDPADLPSPGDPNETDDPDDPSDSDEPGDPVDTNASTTASETTKEQAPTGEPGGTESPGEAPRAGCASVTAILSVGLLSVLGCTVAARKGKGKR